MKKVHLILTIGLFLVLGACSKEESSETTTPSNNNNNPPTNTVTCDKFCAKINGVLTQIDSATGAERGLPNAMFIGGYSKGLQHIVSLMVNPFTGVGEYYLNSAPGVTVFSQYVSVGNNSTTTRTATEVKINITQYDSLNKTISGTFEGTYRANGSSEEVKITEGQFKNITINR